MVPIETKSSSMSDFLYWYEILVSESQNTLQIFIKRTTTPCILTHSTLSEYSVFGTFLDNRYPASDRYFLILGSILNFGCVIISSSQIKGSTYLTSYLKKLTLNSHYKPCKPILSKWCGLQPYHGKTHIASLYNEVDCD